jgi:hypothetical protein
MKMKDARERIEECRDESGKLDIEELAEIILWAYDEGWVNGREDLREDLEDLRVR